MREVSQNRCSLAMFADSLVLIQCLDFVARLNTHIEPRMIRSIPLVRACILALACFCVNTPSRAQCVDEELKEELVGARHYRGVQDRLFTKAFRHELSGFGGYYGADLYSSNWLVGGAYTFHFSESLALEASVGFTRFRTAVTDSYERRYPQIQVEERTNKPGRLYFGHLVYSFAYGKLRWFGGDSITRFDLNFALGAGVTDDSTSRGLTGSFGLGTKWYFGKWFALRLDVRDHILRQTLLGEDHLVNDITITAGPAIFLPFGG
jgi:outer membrane beta-barrel protein